jgi:hypothetical protein
LISGAVAGITVVNIWFSAFKPSLNLGFISVSADQSENRGAAESHTNADELAARRRFQLSAHFLIRVKLAKSADRKQHFNTACSR